MTVIAIDGPAGSGKSTVSKLVAARVGLDVLDTGALYRAVTWAVLEAGVDPGDEAEVGRVATRCDVTLPEGRVLVDSIDVSDAIRDLEVSESVSEVSAHTAVRIALRPHQRRWMADNGGGVVEGRDIGTVVFPDADVKVFLDADPLVRARRRAGEGLFDEGAALSNIESRDMADSSRADSPLSAAADAIRIDTSTMSLEEVVDAIVALVNEA